LLHLYSTFLGTKGKSQPPPMCSIHGWCNGSHIAPKPSPHTSLLVERRVMKPISIYSGTKKYLVSLWLSKFSYLEWWVIFIIGTLQLRETKWEIQEITL